MRRRDFMGVICGAALATPCRADAQQASKVWRIGDVLVTTPERGGCYARALEQALSDLGDVQGRNILLTQRFAGPQPNNVRKVIPLLLPEIDLLVARATIGGVAAKELARDMPTVFFQRAPRSKLGSSKVSRIRAAT
jgi:putative tryptophan/tyrosine transport system substrate-binding protein